MTGAIEFLKNYRNLCNASGCDKCKMVDRCLLDVIHNWTDKDITELVRKVMAESRKGGKNGD